MEIKNFKFSPEKNKQLIEERNISFEEVVDLIVSGKVLDVTDHKNQIKYPGQKVYILDIGNYVCMVPFVYEDRTTVFLKAIIPSRKLAKVYRMERDNE